MKKNVLVIYYSQSGQLKQIADQLTAQLIDCNVVFYEIRLQNDYPFPWTGDTFFDSFPDAFQQRAQPMEPIPQALLEQSFDLVLFHYQVWFLSPSTPITSFLKNPDGQKLLAGKPVVTVSGTRNMWILAQEKVKRLLQDAGAQLVGNIALVDRAPNLVSVVTIVDWLFSGQKRRFMGIFPLPGVSEADIRGASRFGKIIAKHLHGGSLDHLQPDIVAAGGVEISSFLLSVDQKGNKIFKKWAQLIDARPAQRKTLLKAFNIYVVLALYVVSPIVFVFHHLTYPFWSTSFKKEKAYFQSV